MTYKKKLIEVALPLEAINVASADEDAVPRRGHPRTIHTWFARRPLAACRAVLFASLVDDPSSHPNRFPTEEDQRIERERLFRVIEDLVKWENVNNEEVLEKAKAEILRSTDGKPPTILDPFCGGGSIPLEAQRLGLEAHGSDLNPVPVLITKALIEIPPKFLNHPPINPESSLKSLDKWYGNQGLAEDVRYYAKWIRDEAEKRIGHLYPAVELPKEYGGGTAKVLAWFWARTVKCTNPACGALTPMARSFVVSENRSEKWWAEPVIDNSHNPPIVSFQIKKNEGNPPEGTKNRRGTKCICCGTPIPLSYVRDEGKAKRMGMQMTAIVVEGKNRRIYLSPDQLQVTTATEAIPNWIPDSELPKKALGFRVQNYGITKHSDLFTSRQLVALTTFSDLILEVKQKVKQDAIKSGIADLGKGLNSDQVDALAHAEAITVYIACVLSRLADYNSTICTWNIKGGSVRNTFPRPALAMSWDFIEINPLEKMSGNLIGATDWVSDVIKNSLAEVKGSVKQADATTLSLDFHPCISTDPPYYDNVPYADPADFFYIWLRRCLSSVYPEVFSTLLTPKDNELVADQFRFGGKEKAKHIFEEGLTQAFSRMREVANTEYPITIFYAFKQSESGSDDDDLQPNATSNISSTGWETMLEGLLKAGFTIHGTLPMRTERSARTRGIGSNALASSIVLVCRPRPDNATSTTRRQFLNELKRELPDALKKLQQGNIAPVDLAQASIGPGMAVYSKYAKVLEPDGSAMRVRTALQLINQALDEYFAEQEGEFDTDTRWALAWFEQSQFNEGAYGDAETLSTAKNISVQGLVNSGILFAKGGKVRLLKRDELPAEWNPDNDSRVPAWEVAHHLIRALDKLGETGAANLLAQVGIDKGETAKDLSYRLYSICDRKGWTQLALDYNSLVISWQAIVQLASAEKKPTTEQGNLFNT